MNSIEAKKTGRPQIPNRQGLYAKTAKHAATAIDTLVSLLSSNNENIRLGSAKALLDKCLPDLKPTDTNPIHSEPLQVYIVSEGTCSNS